MKKISEKAVLNLLRDYWTVDAPGFWGEWSSDKLCLVMAELEAGLGLRLTVEGSIDPSDGEPHVDLYATVKRYLVRVDSDVDQDIRTDSPESFVESLQELQEKVEQCRKILGEK